jgi:DNA primase
MNMVNETTFKALWNVVKRSGERPVAGAVGRELDPDRARSRRRGEEIPLEMLGCVIDCPEILDDPRVETAASLLEGEIALTIGLARNLRSVDASSAESFVARVPATIQDFAARRLSKPRHQEAGAALFEFLRNAEIVERHNILRENETLQQEIERARTLGDSEQEDQLLLQLAHNARKKRGL